MVNERKSSFHHVEIEQFLSNRNINLIATIGSEKADLGAYSVIIATPTDYNHVTHYFVTKSVETVICDVIKVIDTTFIGLPVVNDLDTFTAYAGVIIANGYSQELSDVSNKLFA